QAEDGIRDSSVTGVQTCALPISATIAESMHRGPHPRRLDSALGTSHSRAPFRNRSEAFDTAWPSQSLEQAKVPHAVLPGSPPSEIGRASCRERRYKAMLVRPV